MGVGVEEFTATDTAHLGEQTPGTEAGPLVEDTFVSNFISANVSEGQILLLSFQARYHPILSYPTNFKLFVHRSQLFASGPRTHSTTLLWEGKGNPAATTLRLHWVA